jgi:hypothetical protein
MASAGRILILPKGNYNAEKEYEMLDLVFYGGVSWVAKKNVKGIEPTDATSEHWMKMCESVDLTEVIKRIAALESQMLGTISLDDIDLTPYATKKDLESYLKLSGGSLTGQLEFSNDKGLITANDYGALIRAIKDGDNYRHIRVGNPTQITDIIEALKLVDCSNGTTKEYKVYGEHNKGLIENLITTALSGVSGVKFYTGVNNRQNTDNIVTFSCTFPPKLIIALGKPTSSGASYFSITVIIPDQSTGLTLVQAGSQSIGSVNVSKSGNNVTISHTDNVNMAPYYTCNSASMTYPYICIG